MRNYLIKGAILFASTLATKATIAQSIPNGNFENWITTSIDKPNNWISTNDDYSGGPICVSKTSDSRSGFAIKLETKETGFGTGAAGFFINTSSDPLIAEGGVPYSQIPDGINGFYKGNFIAGDSAIILVIFKKNGQILSQYLFKIGTSTNTYTPFNFTFDFIDNPDTVIFGAASSDIVTNQESAPGNSIIFDDITFTGTGINQQLNNTNFNDWSSSLFYDFADWTPSTNAVTRSTDKYKGESAALISVTDLGDGFIFGGNLTLGKPNENMSRQGIPYNKTDDTLTFYYKFNSVGDDSASVIVGLFKQGFPILNLNIILEPTSTYQQVNIPLNVSLAPDTISMSFAVAQSQINPASLGSILIIDEVTFASEPINTGLNNWIKSTQQTSIYPNPMISELNIRNQGYINANYKITDITGKVILSGNVDDNPINIGELQNGIYLITLISNGRVICAQKVVKAKH